MRWLRFCRRGPKIGDLSVERPAVSPLSGNRWFESISLQRRVGCELDSLIMVGADGFGSKEGLRVFSLIVLTQFV